MKKGFTLLEILIVLLITSLFALASLPNWQKSDGSLILAKEQHRLYLFLRRVQARAENSTEIWYLILNRDMQQQRWCMVAQLKNEMSCDCFNPDYCPPELAAHFYYPFYANKTAISTKAFYPQKLISFNGTRNSTDPACFVLQAEENRTLFSFSNLGRVRLKTFQPSTACNAGSEE
ncbi:prepilin-type N-terminal cleavage/methylation domain-containing protein [Pasteurellaceae bacterium Pebbles2]|nr:prepilin-type N-terminal cleavage/methylation domain-containing protein [Pasteurellaceae bacterium Pebbles2]